MKKKSTSQSAFFNFRVLIGLFVFLAGVFLALLATGAFSSAFAQARGAKNNRSATQASPGTQRPDVVQMVGPVALNMDLRKLPYIAPKEESEKRVLTRYPHGTAQTGASAGYGISGLAKVQQLVKNLWRPAPNMPPPLLTFEGESAAQACACAPPDSDGDVGPNHYVEAVNEAFRVFDKNGTALSPVTTYNSLFAPLTGTPCSGNNQGDPYALYDPVADRWVISDFAFPSFPGTSFYQCIAVSQTSDPVSGGWFLYALQVDPTNPQFLGDYPKFGFWNAGGSPAQNAYFLTMNEFTNGTTFNGVRAYALDRASMLTGGPANAIGFSITPATLGDSYSLVASTFRTGTAPPAGENEFLLAIDSPATGGVTLTTVKGWLFHVDFVTPANSTLGLGANHAPNALMTVSPFVDAFTSGAGFAIVPQQGTADRIETLGDKIMTPVVYQNRAGTESLWASGTVCTDVNCTVQTGVRWYQFNVTGGTFPATPVQQQTWTNGNDGLYRFMSSIAVDNAGNTAIGYATSSSTAFPGIRYAGRLAGDPPNDLGQGENTMFTGSGSQTDTFGRWGDYSMTTIDPVDGMSFWTVGEYYATTSSFNWHTRVGKFDFVGGGPTPTPTPTPACSWSAGPDLNPPDGGVRLVGVFFPANGKFYGMGGRSSDLAGSDFTHPFEYDPVTNTWTTKSATYPDAHVNNMACGVLNDAGTDYIYCVGGSQATVTGVFDRVFRYDPVTDAITTVAAPWPGAQGTLILPGGFSVFQNKLYILGGFNNPVAMTDQIWEFTPTTNVWVQKSAVLPVPLGYIPTTTIGNFIYTGGGSAFDPVAILVDTTNAFKYDPTADSITTIASIPRATAETRALNFNDQMLVMGGGRTAPNPSNEVDIYDPGTDTWSTGNPPSFVTARRNFPTDTDGSSQIWLAGGYAPTAATASMEIFFCPQATPTPTPTPTVTPTPTPTPGVITLSAHGRRVQGRHTVDLTWSPVTSPNIDIYRDGVLIAATVPNTGSYKDFIGVRGGNVRYTYKVCEAGTQNCSNEVTVRFGGPPL
jgi:N-acetylneuraminic acid mutarotase